MNMENYLWQEAPWADKTCKANELIQYLGETHMLTYQYRPSTQTERRFYSKKIKAYLPQSFLDDWLGKGISLHFLDMTEHWMAAVPALCDASHEVKLPVMVKFLQGNYEDDYWPQSLCVQLESYLMAAMEDHRILIVILSDRGPDRAITYPNILQEASALFPCDMQELYLDVSGAEDKLTQFLEAPISVEQVTALHIPGIPLKGLWENRRSLTRDLVMTDKYSLRSFDRERFLRSETGQKLIKGICLEYHYDSINDVGLHEHFQSIGLCLSVHRTSGRRWLFLYPKTNTKAQKMPLVCALQEVYEGNEHLAVTALSSFYETCCLAAEKQYCIVFYAMEDPDSNDLLIPIIDEAAKLYPLDTNRVYVMGHSHNGRFTLELGARNYRRIAAIATLGNFCGLEDWEKLGAAGVSDERMEQLSTITLPTVNFCGCEEHGGKLPVNVDASKLPLRPGQECGRTLELEDRLYAWKRRLYAYRCRQPGEKELLDAANSSNEVERVLGFPVDRSEIRLLDGLKHYIGDLKDSRGRYLLQMIAIENTPHVITPGMCRLAWEFMSRFSRAADSGETIELRGT